MTDREFMEYVSNTKPLTIEEVEDILTEFCNYHDIAYPEQVLILPNPKEAWEKVVDLNMGATLAAASLFGIPTDDVTEIMKNTFTRPRTIGVFDVDYHKRNHHEYKKDKKYEICKSFLNLNLFWLQLPKYCVLSDRYRRARVEGGVIKEAEYEGGVKLVLENHAELVEDSNLVPKFRLTH